MTQRFTLFALSVLFALLLAGCTQLGKPTSSPTAFATLPPVQFNGTTLAKSVDLGRQFVESSSTFAFDGIPQTLAFVNSEELDREYSWRLTYSYNSQQAGYGDRTGQALAPVVTPHEIVLEMTNGTVTSAVVDGKYDELTHQAVGPPDVTSFHATLIQTPGFCANPGCGTHLDADLNGSLTVQTQDVASAAPSTETRTVSPASALTLAEWVRDSDFFSLLDEYQACPGPAGQAAAVGYCPTHAGSTLISIELNGQYKRVLVRQTAEHSRTFDDLVERLQNLRDESALATSKYSLADLTSRIQTRYSDTTGIQKCVAQIGCTQDVLTRAIRNGWRISFFQGSGDCQAGCITKTYYNFIAYTNGTLIEEATTNEYPNSYEGVFCGGFILNAPQCPAGYTCILDTNNPDTGGACAKRMACDGTLANGKRFSNATSADAKLVLDASTTLELLGANANRAEIKLTRGADAVVLYPKPTECLSTSAGYTLLVQSIDLTSAAPAAIVELDAFTPTQYARNECDLYRNADTGLLKCFGCAGSNCVNPEPGYAAYPNGLTLGYNCYTTQTGCALNETRTTG